METVAEEKDEKKDHQHQRGLWFVHDNVNKLDFWNNEWSYFEVQHRKNLGRAAPADNRLEGDRLHQ